MEKKDLDDWVLDEEGPFDDVRDFNEYLDMLDGLKERGIHGLATGNYELVESTVSNSLLEHGIQDVKKGSKEYIKLCRSLLQANIDTWEYEKKYFLNEHPDEPGVPKQGIPSPMPPEEPSESLEKVVQDYWNEKEPTWKERTKTEIRKALDHMTDFVGKDTQINKIDAKVMRDYKQFLLTEKTRSGNPRTIKTINDKYLCFTKALFSFAKSNQYIHENPAEGIMIRDKNKKRPHEQQDPFSKDDLRKLFCESREYKQDKHKKPCNFWIPIIGLYTGMRLEEISQLYVSDLTKIDGVWCLDVKEEEDKPDKSVKTGEKRVVPLHPSWLMI